DIFCEQLTNDSPSAGAQCRANGDLPLVHGRSGQEQVRHVGTSDQQHAAYGPEQHPEREARSADQLLLQGNEFDDPSSIRVGKVLCLALSNGIHLGLSLGDCYLGFETSNNNQAVPAATPPVFGTIIEWYPNVGLSKKRVGKWEVRFTRKVKARRHD